MSWLARFRRNKEDPEISRRAWLLRAGRLGEATVLDADADEGGNVMLSYSYTVGGVNYQSFQQLDAEQLRRRHEYLPDAHVTLRYDPRRPANSIVV